MSKLIAVCNLCGSTDIEILNTFQTIDDNAEDYEVKCNGCNQTYASEWLKLKKYDEN